MSSPVSTLDWKILSEALLGGLPEVFPVFWTPI
jgi:hypothetical protein